MPRPMPPSAVRQCLLRFVTGTRRAGWPGAYWKMGALLDVLPPDKGTTKAEAALEEVKATWPAARNFLVHEKNRVWMPDGRT